MIEKWEILDNNGNPTGEIMEKYDKKVFNKGIYHLAADVWIINIDGNLLFNSLKKKLKKRGK